MIEINLEKVNSLRLENTPFFDKLNNTFSFPYKLIYDRVYVWPIQIKETFGKIIIPEKYQKEYASPLGLVLAVGDGYFSNKGFIKTEVKVGDIVLYDKQVPWKMNVRGIDDKLYEIIYLGERDIVGRIEL